MQTKTEETKPVPEQAIVHTPGPWFTLHESSAIGTGDMTIARVYWSEGRSDAENTANARLMAASPDMLDVLNRFVAWDKRYPNNTIHSKAGEWQLDELFNAARAVISKVV
jgi:hypothetical protein